MTKSETVMVTFRVDDEDIRKMDVLAKYLNKLGRIKTPARAELIRYALNCLFMAVRREIEQERYGRGAA